MYDFLFYRSTVSVQDIVIIPHKAKDKAEAGKLREIISFFMNYIYREKKIYIKPHQDDYYGLYKKWFPECVLLNKDIENDIVRNYNKKHVITTLDFTNTDCTDSEESCLIPILFEHLSTRYLYLLYLACMLAFSLDFNNDFIYLGEHRQIFEKICSLFFFKQCYVTHDAEDLNKECKKIVVINDNTCEKDISKTLAYIKNNPHGLIVIFLNNERRYLFYNPFFTEIMEHIIPFSIKNEDNRKALKMTEDEKILYLYTTDKRIKKDLLTSKIDISLDAVDPQGKNLNLENLYLKGMLDATELKVMQLLEALKGTDQDNLS